MTANLTVNASKKSDVDPNFENQINARARDAKAESENRAVGKQVPWMSPDGWNGDPFDWEAIKKVFNRDQANMDFEKAVENEKAPGNAGDLVATTTQIAYLAVMERAFRARMTYSQFARSMAQQIGRKKGHGENLGTFKLLALEYVRDVLKRAGS